MGGRVGHDLDNGRLIWFPTTLALPAVPMASTVALPEVPGEALETTGFFTAKDASLGDAISEMEQRHFAYSSEFGLDFCKRLVLNEVSCIRGTHEAWMEGPGVMWF